MRVLFLDIDGVLNCHDPHDNGFCGIHPQKVGLLNRIVTETQCSIVLASAWRYMILGGAMTLEGFRYLLTIHGASKDTVQALTSHLPHDRDPNDRHDRGRLAYEWMTATGRRVKEVCALDDGDSEGRDLGYEVNGIPCVHPDRLVGLTLREYAAVVTILNGLQRS